MKLHGIKESTRIITVTLLVLVIGTVSFVACSAEEPKGVVIEKRAFEFPSGGLNTVEIEALIENVGGSGTLHVLVAVTPEGYGTQTEYTWITLKRNEQRYVNLEFILGNAGFNYTYKVWCEEVKARTYEKYSP